MIITDAEILAALAGISDTLGGRHVSVAYHREREEYSETDMATPIDGPRLIACAQCRTALVRHPDEHPDAPKLCLACWRAQVSA